MEDTGIKGGKVTISGDWWAGAQHEIREAIHGCNLITGTIAAHQYKGKYNAEDMLDWIDNDVRQIRKVLEALVTPF